MVVCKAFLLVPCQKKVYASDHGVIQAHLMESKLSAHLLPNSEANKNGFSVAFLVPSGECFDSVFLSVL